MATNGFGRVAVLDRCGSGRRVLRALRERGRSGGAGASIALVGAAEREGPLAREADEVVVLDGAGDLEDALRRARADSAWLGAAPPETWAALAAACTRLHVRHLGWPDAALARAAVPAGAAALAAEAGVPAAGGLAGKVRLLEVVVGRDRAGRCAALAVGDATLLHGGAAVLVECPAPDLSAEEDRAARDLAARLVAALGVEGIASVELVLDVASRHLALHALTPFPRAAPAEEAAAGLDLVRLALALAAGEPLPPPPPDAAGRHAAAARILPRDPDTGAPGDVGRVVLLRLPCDPHVRAEAAVDEGDPAHAAEPLATLIATGPDRAAALARLSQALADADLLVRGTGTSRAWLRALLDRPELRAGGVDAALLGRLAAEGSPEIPARPALALVAAAIEAYEADLDLERARFLTEARRGRPRVGPSSGRAVELRHAGARHRLEVRQAGPDVFRVAAAGAPAVEVRVDRLARGERRLAVGGRTARVLSVAEGARRIVEVDGSPYAIEREPAGLVVSPMPAVVVAIPVALGQRVEAGEPVARIESMKVELAVTAPEAGFVREILTVANAQVDAGAPLLRLEAAAGAVPTAATPLALDAGPDRPAPGPRERYLAGLGALRELLLGFDVAPADARRLAGALAEQARELPAGDAAVLRAEEDALASYADALVLFRRGRAPDAPGDAPPPLEELWRYLHEPEQRGEGLTPGFVAQLRRALGHFGVSLDAPGRELELALLRIQKAHERSDLALAPVLGLLERRLAGEGVAGFEGEGARGLLDRLVEVGQERAPAVADLARELRYRRLDRPAFERVRADVYAQAETDLAAVAGDAGPAREEAIAQLVACPQPLATLLLERMAAAAPGVRARLVEALVRRYYRIRELAPVATREVDGLACAATSFPRDGKVLRLLAGFAPAQAAGRLARALARLAAETPADGDLSVECYLWGDADTGTADALAAPLHEALVAASFPRPLRRASFVIGRPGRGLGREASQVHLTFRGGPARFEEDRRYRGVHPMLFRRMGLDRLSKFELTRLSSAQDVYLYRGVARANPKDERLLAVAEVRDLTPVRDALGRVVGLPHLERMLHEAVSAMRRFQAGRAPHQRLEWNRVMLTLEPPVLLSRDEIRLMAERIVPATEGVGLELISIAARVPDPRTGALLDTLVRILPTGQGISIRYDTPTDRPLEPLGEYQQRVIALRRRGLTHPYELVRMWAPPRGGQADVPPGEFVEHDLDASGALAPVSRPPGQNAANIVVGTVRTFTARYPEGMLRVILLGDPSRAMGSLAEAECRRIAAAIDLAEQLGVPLEWFAVSAGAKISMESGTENMDWISRVLRRIVEFTQRGGEINVVVTGINVGAQPYWNAEATMLMHTRGILVMTPGSAMVLTGKEALEYSGSVSAEDNMGIGGYDRIMGPNGQAQYRAQSLADGLRILLSHYEHTYVAPGERFPRKAATRDPIDRDVRPYPHGPVGGADLATVGDVFSAARNPDRKKPFDIRRVMSAVIDQDHVHLERWHDLRGGDTAVIWGAHLGGRPVCLIGIESRPLPRLEFVPADGPELWSAGTLFPSSSKKIARAINGASGRVPLVVLANLSGFDGSPESMRRLQLEYGAEIGRAVVNFRGPVIFCVVSRYHGGAFVVFSKALREELEAVAVEGARASVIGGAPAAAVVFAREVETRARKDPRVIEAEAAAAQGGAAARTRLAEVLEQVRSAKVGEVAEAFDAVHTVERARRVGSLDAIIAAAELRPWLVAAVERGISRHAVKPR